MWISAPAGYQWGTATTSVVVAVKRGCPYCEESMPPYAELAELEQKGALTAHVLIACPGDADPFGPLWPPTKPKLQTLTKVDLSNLGVVVTPTVLLVGPDGSVRAIWEGTLSSKAQDELVKYLKLESYVND
jgi:uncharacterized OB-fold protein